jgi:rubrerythrin
MPEWLLLAGSLLTFVGGGVWTWAPWTSPARIAKQRLKTESLAGTFQRCATESRGIAKMWEQYDEQGLAQLHQNLALIYQTYCEVYQQADAPAEAAAIVAGTGWKLAAAKPEPAEVIEALAEVNEYRKDFLARQEERIQPRAATADDRAHPGRALGAFAAQQRQLAAALDSAVHGYQYPQGCRCPDCFAEYMKRSSWAYKPAVARLGPPATKVEMVDVTTFGGPPRSVPGAPALGTGHDGHCPMCGRAWDKFESKHGVITYWPCMCTGQALCRSL